MHSSGKAPVKKTMLYSCIINLKNKKWRCAVPATLKTKLMK
jgi:hypothetical protein